MNAAVHVQQFKSIILFHKSKTAARHSDFIIFNSRSIYFIIFMILYDTTKKMHINNFARFYRYAKEAKSYAYARINTYTSKRPVRVNEKRNNNKKMKGNNLNWSQRRPEALQKFIPIENWSPKFDFILRKCVHTHTTNAYV